MSDKTFHLVIRFSDHLFSVGDVIDKHNHVVLLNGYVWFGKMGQAISQTRIDILKSQIANSVPTYLYLVKGNRQKSTFYQADVLDMIKALSEKDRKFIPKYYKKSDLIKYINTWIKISEIISVEPSTLSKFKAANSVFPILETLVRSSSGHFLVHEAKNLF